MKRSLIIILVFFVNFVFAQKTVPSAQEYPCNPRTLPVLWQQTSAEYRALCLQAFNIATLRINEIPRDELKKGNLAIITDLDETILDNSSSDAQMILENKSQSARDWKNWTKQHSALAVPGAVEFLKSAFAQGISIFYISNRDTSELTSTLENLKQLSLPCADMDHMLFLVNTSSKESRRQQVTQNFKVILLLGDNLNDFASSFEKRSIADRKTETDKEKDEWGKKFIVLPNSTYGEWENALYNYQHGLTPAQKDSIRISLLKGYKSK
jgi:5'-nucleotidase (lipoprotein e(P4) family)